jgi:hypothetical protein
VAEATIVVRRVTVVEPLERGDARTVERHTWRMLEYDACANQLHAAAGSWQLGL